jgi:hypothetical protein
MPASSTRSAKRRIVAATLGAALFLATPSAAAEAPTRDEYVAQLEGICKPDTEATQRVMRGARGDVRAERLALAAGKFAQATSIFGSTLAKMSPVPRPSDDAAKLAKWFGYLEAQESYLKQITAQLRADHPIQAQRLTARFIHNGNLANNTALVFGFRYCSFKFSRYG